MSGLIHIYTGDGKGKTTAGVGLTIRCAGRDNKVTYTQFLKNDHSGELKILETIDNIQLIHATKSFGFVWNMTEEQKKEAKIYYTEHLKKVIDAAEKNGSRLLVLDEIIATYNNNLVDREFLINFLKTKPAELEVVLTGREPAQELMDLADYVSEIKKIKHPFDQGIPARIGIEK